MKKLITILLVALAITSCSNDDDNNTPTTQLTNKAFIENYAQIVASNYDDSYNTAVTMKETIDAFLQAPSEDNLNEAKEAWLYARDFYGQTEAFREAEGPIDNDDLLGTEGQINAWPLDEAYIDYVSDNRGGSVQNGYIGDTSFELTEANLIANNAQNADETDVTVGWHAIEFLLWGQDLNYDPDTQTQTNFSDAGNRPYTDYTTADFADRRSTYLQIVTDLLVKDLKDLRDTWAQGGSYRTTFLALDEDEALTNILNGIGFISNGEVAQERIFPAIDEGQENEHSCFSDNTNQDMWANVHGINNIIVGSYTTESGTKISGVSLIDIVKRDNEALGNNLDEKADETLAKLNALLAVGKTFDEIINEETLESGGVAFDLATALIEQSTAISDAAGALGVNITVE